MTALRAGSAEYDRPRPPPCRQWPRGPPRAVARSLALAHRRRAWSLPPGSHIAIRLRVGVVARKTNATLRALRPLERRHRNRVFSGGGCSRRSEQLFSQAPLVTKSGGREHKECCPCAGSPSRSGQRAGPARVHQIRNVSLSLSEERVGERVALL